MVSGVRFGLHVLPIDSARSITTLSPVGVGVVIFGLLLASLVLLTFLDASLESCDQPGLDEPHF